MTIEMADAIVSPQTTGQPIPSLIRSAQAVAGYSAGNSWETFEPFCEARPDLAKKGWVVSITLTCMGKGRCYDIEPGGGENQNIGVFKQHADYSQGLPWLYTFASNGEAMLQAAKDHAGWVQGRDFYYWSSHTGRGPHICAPDVCGYPRADGTQHSWESEVDISTLNDYMLPSHPVHIDPYAMFPTNLPASLPNKGNERLTVEQTDGALMHPDKYHDYLVGTLYGELKTFRDRIWKVSHYEPPAYNRKRPQADWSDRRGERWQALNSRMIRITKLT